MTFQSFLQQPFANEELLAIAQLEEEIHHLQAGWPKLETAAVAKGLKALAELRLKASSTLLRGEHHSWFLVNGFIQNKIQEQQEPAWIDICKINRDLTNLKGDIVRKQEIYTGHLQACPYAELEMILTFFQNNILPYSDTISPLVHAALCQYWLVSIHPFKDGNGRTSILLTDWLLTKNGYLPQSFASKIDAIVMYIPGRVKKMTPGMSVIRILQNVVRSYRCFEYKS